MVNGVLIVGRSLLFDGVFVNGSWVKANSFFIAHDWVSCFFWRDNTRYNSAGDQ